MGTVSTSSVILNYSCEECGNVATQFLTEVVESGTAICPEDGAYMAISDVTINKGE